MLSPDIQVSLHSLRGAVQVRARAGVSVDGLQEDRPWSSEAYKAYLNNNTISTGLSWVSADASTCHRLVILCLSLSI